MKAHRNLCKGAVLAAFALTCWLASPQAYGSVCLYLTPDGTGTGVSAADPLGPIDYGNENNTPDIEAVLDSKYGITDDPKYKIEYDGNKEEGDLLGSYSTLFGSDEDFTISYEGGPVVTGTVYLLVKDGKQIPAWYLFDITGWDGDCGIQGTGFWADTQGGISFVAIYGQEGVIPEPTMLLVWSGLAGMALQVRRRRV